MWTTLNKAFKNLEPITQPKNVHFYILKRYSYTQMIALESSCGMDTHTHTASIKFSLGVQILTCFILSWDFLSSHRAESESFSQRKAGSSTARGKSTQTLRRFDPYPSYDTFWLDDLEQIT